MGESRRPYTEAELEVVADDTLSHRQVAERLGRTPKAIEHKRERFGIRRGNAWSDRCRRGHILAEVGIYVRPDGQRQCRGCRRLGRADRRHYRAPTCGKGHEFTPENTRISHNADGSVRRHCRTCQHDRELQRRAKTPRPPAVIDLPGEVWLPVVGNSWYTISNKGRCCSEARKGVPERRLVKPHAAPSGHLRIGMRMPGRKNSKTRFVHHLVLDAFAGLRPEGTECCHGPGGPADNRWPENIRWDTRIENELDKYRHKGLEVVNMSEVLRLRARIAELEEMAG